MRAASPSTRSGRLIAAAVPAALVVLLVLAPVASADLFSPESGGSKNADQIDSLYWWVTVLAVIVFLGVEGILIYSLVKFRAGKGKVAAQIHGNTQLEIGWTVGAAVLLIFLTVVTFIKLPDIKNPPATDLQNGLQVPRVTHVDGDRDQPAPPGGRSLHIKVDGQQYVWRYQYPQLEEGADVFAYEEMVVPSDTTVTLDVSADDVAHAWWIPKLGGKVDALPGYLNKTWFKADTPGKVYEGQCAELCGRNHAQMLARVRVVTPQEFQKWYSDKVAEIKSARDEGAKQREAFEQERGG